MSRSHKEIPSLQRPQSHKKMKNHKCEMMRYMPVKQTSPSHLGVFELDPSSKRQLNEDTASVQTKMALCQYFNQSIVENKSC